MIHIKKGLVLILALILGLLSSVLIALLVVAVHSLFSFDLTSFSLFFIVPVGAIFIGTVACYGYYRGMFKSNQKLTSSLKWLGVVLALATYAAVQYGFYHTAYLDADMNLNFKMQGEHIGQFIFAGEDEPINWLSFTKRTIESRTISFAKYGSNLFDVKGNTVVNWIFFGIDVLGIAAGSLIARGLVIGNRKYCDQCRRYMKQKDLFNFLSSDQETMQKLMNIDSLSTEEINALLTARMHGHGAYYDVHLDWCTECSGGYLQLKLMQPDEKGKMKHNEEQSIEIRLTSVSSFLAA